MSITRRIFLRNTAVAGAAVAVTPPTAVAEPEKTPRELAVWHMRQLESLLRDEGSQLVHVAIIAEFSKGDCRAMAIQDSGKLVDRDGLFAPKGGAA